MICALDTEARGPFGHQELVCAVLDFGPDKAPEIYLRDDLQALSARVAQAQTVLVYNGLAYDAPLLRRHGCAIETAGWWDLYAACRERGNGMRQADVVWATLNMQPGAVKGGDVDALWQAHRVDVIIEKCKDDARALWALGQHVSRCGWVRCLDGRAVPVAVPLGLVVA